MPRSKRLRDLPRVSSASASNELEQSVNEVFNDVPVVNTTTNIRRKRGTTTLADIYTMPVDEQIQLEWSENGQPISAGAPLFSSWCGVVARNPTYCPINYPDWRCIPDAVKDEAYKAVLNKFVIPERNKKFVLQSLAKKWRDNKYKLKKKFYLNKDNPDKEIPSGQVRDQWLAIVEYWNSEGVKKKAKTNLENRSNQKYTHTSGSRSFARTTFLHEQEVGQKVGVIEMFDVTHRHKDGTYIADAAAEFAEKLKKVAEDTQSENQHQNSIAIEKEVFKKVWQEEHIGRVCRTSFVSHSSDGSVNNVNEKSLREEFADLKAEFDRLVKNNPNFVHPPSSSQTHPVNDDESRDYANDATNLSDNI